jgi:hypothetical protein
MNQYMPGGIRLNIAGQPHKRGDFVIFEWHELLKKGLKRVRPIGIEQGCRGKENWAGNCRRR